MKTLNLIALIAVLLSTARCEEAAVASTMPKAAASQTSTIQTKTRCQQTFDTSDDQQVYVKVEKAVLVDGSKFMTCSLVRHANNGSIAYDTVSSNSAVLAFDETEECITTLNSPLDVNNNLTIDEATMTINGATIDGSIFTFSNASCSQVYPK